MIAFFVSGFFLSLSALNWVTAAVASTLVLSVCCIGGALALGKL